MTPPWLIDRVQRRRTKGSKLPPRTLCVTRGTLFGNPFRVEDQHAPTKHAQRNLAVLKFNEWIKAPEQADLVQKFIRRCRDEHIEHIACFCDTTGYTWCHGAIWIEIWNAQGNDWSMFPLSQERRLQIARELAEPTTSGVL